MGSDVKREVSRGRRGSNKTKLVLVGVVRWEDRKLVEPIDTARGSRVVCVVDIA